MTTQPIILAPSAEPVDKPIRVGLLGPLHVCGGPGPSAKKERQTLALLALNPGAFVSVTDLIWELWVGKPPRQVAQSVQTYVMYLRRIPDLVIETRPRGYALAAEPFEVDALRFTAYVGQAHRQLAEGRLLVAQDTLTAAFSLWRGQALSEVECGPLLTAHREALDDARRTALGLRWELALRAGRHREIVDDLAAEVRLDPAREDIAAKLMVALYRCNRRADALRVFHAVRAVLVEEYGLEPCPALQRLQGQILAGDPSLELNAE